MLSRLASKLTGKHGPLGVFAEYPVLLQLGLICTFAEMAWATLLLTMEFYFKEEILVGSTEQFIASKVALAFLAFTGAETLFKYPMGALADKYGVRRFVLMALGICSITPLIASLATNWWHFLPLRAIDGFAAAALWPCMSALMARSVPRQAKASAMSVFNAAYCFGLAVGPAIGLYIGHIRTNRDVFPLCAVVMFAGFLLAWKYIPHHVPPSKEGRESFEDERHLLRGRPMLVKMMGLYALSQVGVGILAPTIPIFIDSQFGLKQQNLPGLIAIPALAIVAIALPLGRAADYIGRAKAVWISYALATFGIILIASSSLFKPTTGTSLPLIMFGVGVLAMIASYILGTPAWLGITSLQVDDKRQGQALSLMQTAQGVGVVLALALVASAGHLMTKANAATESFRRMSGRATPLPDDIPLSIWFWIAAVVFTLVFIGTLLWVREPPHSAEAEEEAKAEKQPLEISGF